MLGRISASKVVEGSAGGRYYRTDYKVRAAVAVAREMLAFLAELVALRENIEEENHARRAREVSDGCRALRPPGARKPGNTGGILDRRDRAAGARRQDRDGAPVAHRDRDDVSP